MRSVAAVVREAYTPWVLGVVPGALWENPLPSPPPEFLHALRPIPQNETGRHATVQPGGKATALNLVRWALLICRRPIKMNQANKTELGPFRFLYAVIYAFVCAGKIPSLPQVEGMNQANK